MDNMVTKDLASNIKFNNVNITDSFWILSKLDN